MKRIGIIVLLLASLIALGCIKNCVDVSAKRMERATNSSFTVNGKETIVVGYTIEEEYVIIPFMKTIAFAGWHVFEQRFSEDHKHTTAYINTGEKILYIDFFHRFLMLAGDQNNKSDEEVNLLVGSPENPHCYLLWDQDEVFIDDTTFKELFQKLGMEVSIDWDYEKKTVSILIDSNL